MKLVAANDVLDFLSQAAPRPWVRRMLSHMVSSNEMQPYFSGGWIQSEVSVFEILVQIPIADSESASVHRYSSGPSTARDASVREHFSSEIADKIKEKQTFDNFVEYNNIIEMSGDFDALAGGFFEYGILDWKTGTLSVDFIPDQADRPEHVWWGADELLTSDFERPSFTAEFRGVSFPHDQIELLLPSHRLDSVHVQSVVDQKQRRTIGRPRRWDWEAAVAATMQIAILRGFLTGASGMQAKIEEAMADWFIQQTGDAPATSQIRSRASRLVEMARKAEK